MTEIVSVHLDIARFCREIYRIKTDSELSEWAKSLAECLALRDKSLNEFGAKLLTEAEDFSDRFSSKQRENAIKGWEKRHAMALPNMPRDAKHATDQAEQTDQKEKTNTRRFAPPSLDQVRELCSQRKNGIDPQAFFAYYESNGWKVGNKPMKKWEAAMTTWETRRKNENAPVQKQPSEFEKKYPGHKERQKAEEAAFYAELDAMPPAKTGGIVPR